MAKPPALDGRDVARLAMAALYLVVGTVHIANPETFMPVMPKLVPRPKQVIIGTGLCEIAGAVGLLTPKLRYAAGWALALYAVCVFPANIKHAWMQEPVGGMRLNRWYHAPRLAFQPVFVWWALWVGGVLD